MALVSQFSGLVDLLNRHYHDHHLSLPFINGSKVEAERSVAPPGCDLIQVCLTETRYHRGLLPCG